MFFLQFICYNIILLLLSDPHNLLIDCNLFHAHIPVHVIAAPTLFFEIHCLAEFFEIARQDILLQHFILLTSLVVLAGHTELTAIFPVPIH